MSFPSSFEPFIEGANATVLTRMCVQRLIDAETMNELFEELAEDSYTRELTLSHLVELMVDVACGQQPSPRAAFLARKMQSKVSITAFYGKLNRIELAIAEGIVRRTARQAKDIIRQAKGERPELIPGLVTMVL